MSNEEKEIILTRQQIRQIIVQEFRKYKGKGDNPCWDGFGPGAKTGKKTKIGKSGKRVANCEKVDEAGLDEKRKGEERKVKKGSEK